MDIRKINEENIEDYAELLDADTLKNMEREYFSGLAFHKSDDEPAGSAIVWELKNTEDDIDTEAELEYIQLEDENAGKLLFESFKKEVSESDVKRSFFELESFDEQAEKTASKEGYNPQKKESRDIVVTLEELSGLSILKKPTATYVTAINELMVRQYRKGITNCLFHGRKGLLEDLAFLPMSWFDQDVSSCVQTDGRATGFLLVHKTENDKLVVDLLFAMEPDAKINLLQMIRYSVNAAAEKYPADTEIVLRRHNDMSKGLIEKLFPDKKGVEVLTGEREE